VVRPMDRVFSLFKASPTSNLGPLELQVLEVVWGLGTATVREVVRDGKLWQTYPTIMTTMDRLFKKGLFNRVAEGRAFRYSPRYGPEELERIAAQESIRQLLSSQNASLHLSYLVEAAGTQDEKLLDELEALVERQRAELKRGEPK
jgi:predicted transcriptional regulator